MTTLASLSVDLDANIVRFSAAMDAAASVADKNMRSIEMSASRMAGKVSAAIAGALSVGALLNMTKNALDAADAMGAAAERAQMAVEQFSALAYAAKQSDVPMEALEVSVKKLSDSIVLAAEGSGKFVAAFNVLGVKVRDSNGQIRDTHQVLDDVANAFAKAKDGPEKVAIAMALMGKSGSEAIPLLNKGAAAIHFLENEAAALGKTIDGQTAAAASQFNKDVEKLTDSSATLARTLVTNIVPALDDVVRSMIRGKQEAGLYGAAIAGLSAIFDKIGGGNSAVDRLEKINDQIRAAQGSKKTLQDQPWWATFGQDSLKDAAGQLDSLYKIRESILHEIHEIEQAAQDARAIRGQIAAGKKPLNTSALGGGMGGQVAFDMENASLEKEIANLTKVSELDAYATKLGEQRFATLSPAQKQFLMEQAETVINLRQEIETRKELIAADTAYLNGIDQIRSSSQAYAQTLRDQIAQETFDISTIGKSTDAIAKLTAVRQIDLDQKKQLAALPEDATGADIAAIIAKADAQKKVIAALIDQKTALTQQVMVWGDIATKAGAFFGDLVVNGHSAFDHLRDQAKSFLQDLIAIFAQRWILQMAAGITGSTVLGNAAASVGQGTVAGAASGFLGSVTGASSLAEGISMGFQSGIAAQGAIGEHVGVWLANYGWVAGVAAAILATGLTVNALFSAGWTAQGLRGGPGGVGSTTDMLFRPGAGLAYATGLGDRLLQGIGLSDRLAGLLSGSPVMDRLFGHGATHADAQGIMGDFSGTNFSGQNWQDFSQRGGVFSSDHRWTDTAAFDPNQASFFSSLFQGITSTVGSFGHTLGVDPNTVLAGYSHPFNIQTTNNGAPLSDADMQAQLGTLFAGVLQDQVTMLLTSSGHDKLADYVHGLTGSGDQIAATIQDLANVMAAVPNLHMTGLTAEALLDWKQGTETLGQTFQRVATQMGTFDDAFMTDTQKFAAAQEFVASTFQDLGIAVPQSSAAFYDLVHGLDLSTESGRHMFDVLMSVAPAFQTVEQAAASTIATFNQIAGQLSPSFGQSNARGALEASVQQWMALSPGNSQGWTVDSTIQNIGSLISSNQIGSAMTYAQTLGGNAGDVLNKMLIAYQAWQSTLTSSTTNLSSGFAGLGTAVTGLTGTLTDSVQQTRDGIGQWLHGLFLDQSLSPLAPGQRLDFAHDAYVENLMKAQANDPTALSQFTSFASDYLKELLSYYGPNAQYLAGFSAVTQQAGGLAGLSDQRPITATDLKSGFASVVAELKNLQTLTGQQGSALEALAGSLKGAVTKTATQVTEAVRDGALTFSS